MDATLWVNQKLSAKINANGNIQLDDMQEVDIPTFCTFFGDTITNDSITDKYTSLCGSHNFEWNGESVTRSADELGYKTFFDQWHSEGLI